MENNKFDPQAEDGFNLDLNDDIGDAFDPVKDKETVEDKVSNITNNLTTENDQFDNIFDTDSQITETSTSDTQSFDNIDLNVAELNETDTTETLDSDSGLDINTNTESADIEINTSTDYDISNPSVESFNNITDTPITDPLGSTVDQLDALNANSSTEFSPLAHEPILQEPNKIDESPLEKFESQLNSQPESNTDLIATPDSTSPEPLIDPKTGFYQETPEKNLDTDSISDSLESTAAAITTPRGNKNLKDKKKSKSKSANMLKLAALGLVLIIAGLLAFLFIDNGSEPQPTEVKEQQPTPPTEQVPDNNKSDQPQSEGMASTQSKETQGDSKTTTDDSAKNDTSKDTAEKTVSADKKDNPPTVNANGKLPDPEKIVNAPIPSDDALVKEEIDRLNDQDKQLIEQQQLLDKRVQMMDELTSKKQEQIELLEKQIAQLEEKTKNNSN